MAGSSWGTPGAILLGFSLVAVATYFGLRDHRSGSGASPATSGAPVADVGSVPSGAPPGAGQAPKGTLSPAVAVIAPEAARGGLGGLQDASQDAATAFEQQLPSLTAACGGAKKDGIPPATYAFNFSFDTDGQEIGRGLSELHDARPEVTACLIAHHVPIAIPTRGARAKARVPFTIP